MRSNSRRNSLSAATKLFNDKSKSDISKTTDTVSNPEINVSVKKMIERINMLYAQQREIFDENKKALELKFKVKHFPKLIEPIEIVNEHRKYLEKYYYHIISANLFNQTVDALFTLYSFHTKYKKELKSMINKHNKNEKKISSLYSVYSELDAKRLNLKDEIIATKYVYYLFSESEDINAERYEEEILNIITHIPGDAIIPGTLQAILDDLETTNIKEIHTRVNKYIDDGRINENIATFILSIGIKCAYFGNPVVGHKIIKVATRLLKTHCNKNTIKYDLLPLAEAFVLKFEDKVKNAATITHNVIESIREDVKFNDIEVMNLVLHLAYLVEKWNNKLGASSAMEEIVMNLAENLPESEVNWLKASTITARIFNNQMKPDQAMYYLTKAIDYYHEKMFGEISPTNKPIHEIANELKGRGQASATLIQALSPRLGYLPPALMECLNELCITFTLRSNHNAVNIVEKYIKDCKNAHQEFIISDDDEDKGVTLFQMTKGKAYEKNKAPKKLNARRMTQTTTSEPRMSFLKSQRASFSESLTGKIRKMSKLKKKSSKDSASSAGK